MAQALRISALLLTLAFAGCLSETPQDVPDMSASPTRGVNATLPKTESETFVLTASFATPLRSFNAGMAAKTITPAPNITGFIAEVVWMPGNQAQATMSVWIRKVGDGAVSPENPLFLINSPPALKQVDGKSPLKVVLPAEIFKEQASYNVILRASAAPVGAAVNQEAKLYLTTFDGVPFDESYSGLPK